MYVKLYNWASCSDTDEAEWNPYSITTIDLVPGTFADSRCNVEKYLPVLRTVRKIHANQQSDVQDDCLA